MHYKQTVLSTHPYKEADRWL